MYFNNISPKIKTILTPVLYYLCMISSLLIIYNIVSYYHCTICTGWRSVLMVPTPVCSYALWMLTNISNILHVTYGLCIMSTFAYILSLFNITNLTPYHLGNN